jgi:hypothetical protein
VNAISAKSFARVLSDLRGAKKIHRLKILASRSPPPVPAAAQNESFGPRRSRRRDHVEIIS